MAQDDDKNTEKEYSIWGFDGWFLWITLTVMFLLFGYTLAALIYLFTISCRSDTLLAYEITQFVTMFMCFALASWAEWLHKKKFDTWAVFFFMFGVLANLGISIWGLVGIYNQSYFRTYCLNSTQTGLLQSIALLALIGSFLFMVMFFIWRHMWNKKAAKEEEEAPSTNSSGSTTQARYRATNLGQRAVSSGGRV